MDAFTRLLLGFGIVIFLITIIYGLSRYLYDMPELKVFNRFSKLKNIFMISYDDQTKRGNEEISFMKKLKDAERKIKDTEKKIMEKV